MSNTRIAALSCVSALAIIAALGIEPSAAADMPMPMKAPPMMAPPPPSWAGFYVGANVDEMFAKNTVANLSTGPAGSTSFSEKFQSTGFGFHGGYNLQTGNIVYGIEGDYTFYPTMGANGAGPSIAAVAQERISGLWSVRGRLGVAFDSALLYVTGGAGGKVADVDVPGKANLPSVTTNFDKTSGVVGAGIEYKVTPKVSIGLEALYYLTSGSTTVTEPSPGPAVKMVGFSDQDIVDVRARVSYHF